MNIYINNIAKWKVSRYDYLDPQMGLRSISLTVNHPSNWIDGDAVEVADFTDAYVMYKGEKFKLSISKPTAEKKNSTLDYEYKLVFKGSEDELTRRKVRDLAEVGVNKYISQGTSFSLSASIQQFKQLLDNNLRYYFGSDWDVVIAGDSQDSARIDINNTSIWELLQKTYEYYGLRWNIKNKTITIGYEPVLIDHVFDYGKEGGLVKITRTAQDDSTPNRITGTGGSRNLPKNYFTNRYSDFRPDPDVISDSVNIKNLMPKVFRDSVRSGTLPYIDYVEDEQLVALNGVIEDALAPNEDIYPSIAGVEVTGLGRIDEIIYSDIPLYNRPEEDEITEWDEEGNPITPADNYSPTFDIWVKDIGFDLADEKYTSTEEAKISFTTGDLAGYEFTILSEGKRKEGDIVKDKEVYSDTSKSHGGVNSAYRITLIKSDEDFDATNRMLPNTVFYPRAGDSFVIYNIEMPQSYVENAELRLQRWLEAQLEELKAEKPTYAIEIMPSFFKTAELEFDGVSIEDKLEAGNLIRVMNASVTGEMQTLHINNLTVEYKDLLPKYRFTVTDKVSVDGNAVGRLQSQLDAVVSRQLLTEKEIDAILSGFSTKFLSKIRPDIAQQFIQFLKGISVEGLATFLDGLTSEGLATFVDGLTAEGLAKFNAGLESAFVLVENEATQGVVQGLTEVDDAPVALKMIAQVFTENMERTSGAERLGDLANVDESFDTVPDAVYSFRKQDGIFYPILGGGSTSARLTLTYVTPATATISLEMPFEIEYMFTSLIDGESTGAGSVTYRVNNRIVGGETIQQGTNVFDVKRHLIIGDNNVVISVTDSYGNTRTLSFRITAVKVELTSTFNANQIFDGNIMFRFIPIGFGTMTIAISVDGSHHGEVVSTQSNRQLTYNIPKLSHGAHIIEAVMTIDSDGEIITSNKLEFSIISIEEGNNTAIIASAFTTAEATQFDTIVIPFTVYNPLSVNTDIDMIVNEEVIQSRVVDRMQQYWSVNLTESGSITLQIKAGSVSKFFYVEVAESNIADLEETEELELKLISEGRNNAESNRDSWEYLDIKSLFNNFNWTSNGWAMDSNGNSYLKVSGDAKLEIPFKIFDTDFKLDGKTIEIQFFTEDVSNLDYVVLSCMQGGKGFEITSQKVTFKSEQSTITTQFKENELIKVAISIEQSAKNRLLSLFINGILSGVLQYPTTDNFIQSIPANIIAQGAEATIGIYTIRIYKTDLQPWQILNNYIFDYPDARERESIYIRNNILGAEGDISYARLVEHLPCLIITGDLPQYKGDKKINEIEFEDRQNPERSFTATNVQNDVQGTSSQYYPRKNYKMKFRNGFDMADGSHKDGFETHDTTLPAVVFTHKADFAEASGTHNTGLAKVIENLLRTLDIKTPPQLIDEKVRTTIDGFASAIFHRQNPEDRPIFIGKYNFNTDKAAENTFGFKAPVECWEVQNNTSRRVLFKESDYVGDDWLNDFEARFPEDNEDYTNLKRMTDWVVSCIGNPTKFRNEFEQYFHKDFMLSYYVITELFAMVDQRAKNCFWTSFDTKIWLPIFYDNDTVLGINNEGVNAFYFDVETHDKLGTQDVWNGADSELWKLLEQAFPSELEAMYQRIRKDDTLSYNSVLNILNGEHSDKWSETVYNEDGQFKYIDPLLVDGNGSYLYAAQGSREEHRKWWLYNRFRYMDSKYNTGDFRSDYITMRLYTPSGDLVVEPDADFTITTFGSQYIRAKWGSYETSQRVKVGDEITFEAPDMTFNDTETILYGASYLKTIGDLSGKYAGTVDVSKGTQLTEVIIGNSTPGYVNTNLHDLNVGNNKLLRKINVENCPNLTQAIDLSGCIGLEEVYAKGSGITGVALSQGGEINILSLPATLINLTIIGHPISQTGLQIEGYNKLSSLHIDSCPNLNSYTLVKDILSKPNTLQNIRLIDIDATDTNLDTLYALASMRGIDDNGFIVANAVISGKFHISTIDSDAYDDITALLPYLTITYDVMTVVPTRTVVVRRAQNNAVLANIPIKINGEDYTTDGSGRVILKTSLSIKVDVEISGYVTKTETFASSNVNTTHYVQMTNYVSGTISVVGKNGYPLNGAVVTLQGKSGITAGGSITLDGLFYATGAELKVVFGGQTHTENVNIGYVNYSKTVTLQVEEIESMKPAPNGNIQILAKITGTSARELVLNVRGWEGQNATIDWGDGSAPEVIVADKTYHTYPDVALYNIEISNATNLTRADLEQTHYSPSYYGCVAAYWTIGNSKVKGIFPSLYLSSKPNLTYLGDDVFINDTDRTDWSYLLEGATKLVNLPASLNKDTIAAGTNFSGFFSKCRITSIPEGLFDNCVNVTSFSYCFEGCESLTSIPEDLFDNCVNVTNFRSCFSSCNSITSIPEGLFDNCVKVTSFANCFSSCRSLTSIPEGLFDNCVNVTSFSYCFEGCESLTSIPEGLFDNCVNVTSFSYCFSSCTSLVYCEIPMLKLGATKHGYISGTSYLTVLVSNSITPPVIDTSSIPNISILKIYVPDASVTAYKTATNWVAYESKIYPLSEYENN